MCINFFLFMHINLPELKKVINVPRLDYQNNNLGKK